ncbi:MULTISPECIES: hypothetical protein [unclassified Leptolyngbya]|uniref:hypothetical protein n=1 Tax=unclassified Leptolyngbya TaxID=2650499 RepID=UPI001689FEDD|nr:MULTISPECIES: hypothetical protein [unclassified Leptolyngbya]MBD1910297.1 hypothetical protein [Leptolyngbya sp. FACHB-8]MBD2155791.1 hypothetical protein [Leptolyngbya sp. FACHB-16]
MRSLICDTTWQIYLPGSEVYGNPVFNQVGGLNRSNSHFGMKSRSSLKVGYGGLSLEFVPYGRELQA